MTQIVVNEKDLPFWKRPFSFTFLIDFVTVLYITSVYIFSFNDLNFISKGLAFVLMGLLVIYAMMKKSIKLDWLGISLGLFILICFMSCLWALDISIAFSSSITMLQILILIVLLYNYIQKEDKTELFITVMCVAATIFAVYTVLSIGIEEYFNGLQDGDRLGGKINNVNGIGMMAASAYLFNMWQLFYRKKRWYILSTAICLIVSLGSGSRTALAGLIFGTVLMFAFKGEKKQRLISVLQCIGILILLYLILQLPAFENLMNRFDRMLVGLLEGEKADSSSETRFDMIELGIRTFTENPILGVGIGNSRIVTQEMGLYTYFHNNYVELLASTGLIGTIVYYMMFLIPLFKLIRPALRQNHFAIITVVLILVNLLFHYGTVDYYNKVSYLYLIFIWMSTYKKKGNKSGTSN